MFEGVSRGLKPIVSRWPVMPGLKSGPVSEVNATTGKSVRRGCGGAGLSWSTWVNEAFYPCTSEPHGLHRKLRLCVRVGPASRFSELPVDDPTLSQYGWRARHVEPAPFRVVTMCAIAAVPPLQQLPPFHSQSCPTSVQMGGNCRTPNKKLVWRQFPRRMPIVLDLLRFLRSLVDALFLRAYSSRSKDSPE